jgi:hypothetical protein
MSGKPNKKLIQTKQKKNIGRAPGHHVDIIVPPGGLGTRLDAIYDFHAQHGIKPQRGQGNSAVIRWCFADASLAEAFTRKFGQP